MNVPAWVEVFAAFALIVCVWFVLLGWALLRPPLPRRAWPPSE